MIGDSLDVLHEGRHVAEHVMINPLKNVAEGRSGLLAVDDKGVVDQPVAVGLAVDEVRLEVEGSGNLS